MIHVGIDTVELHGKYFETLVKKGERFHEGQPLLSFDLEKNPKAAGYDPTVMIIVLNTKDFLEVLPVPESNQSVKLVTTC